MSYPSRKPEQAGILSAWVGTVWIMFTTATFAIPLGIGAGIYFGRIRAQEPVDGFY